MKFCSWTSSQQYLDIKYQVELCAGPAHHQRKGISPLSCIAWKSISWEPSAIESFSWLREKSLHQGGVQEALTKEHLSRMFGLEIFHRAAFQTGRWKSPNHQ